jgi:hypothetical protein
MSPRFDFGWHNRCSRHSSALFNIAVEKIVLTTAKLASDLERLRELENVANDFPF